VQKVEIRAAKLQVEKAGAGNPDTRARSCIGCIFDCAREGEYVCVHVCARFCSYRMYVIGEFRVGDVDRLRKFRKFKV
jgi:hypothetical protein